MRLLTVPKRKLCFILSDKNPLKAHPERFGHSFIDLPNGGTIFQYVDDTDAIPNEAVRQDDIRYVVDELDKDTDYWIVDAYDYLGEWFPAVPDVPGNARPTDYVAVPRDAVVEVYAN